MGKPLTEHFNNKWNVETFTEANLNLQKIHKQKLNEISIVHEIINTACSRS